MLIQIRYGQACPVMIDSSIAERFIQDSLVFFVWWLSMNGRSLGELNTTKLLAELYAQASRKSEPNAS